jgi:superfamily II DNA/RNA helicase
VNGPDRVAVDIGGTARRPLAGHGVACALRFRPPSHWCRRRRAAQQLDEGNEKVLSTFQDLGVTAEISDALEKMGIVTPFPIQQMTLPIALMGTDLIGQARTGTGKTLAFGIPVLQRIVAPHDSDFEELASPGKPQALVITPTRELALQVSGDIAAAGLLRQTRTLTIYGGVSYDEQLATLKSGVDVVVGTPGRLLDLANRRNLDLAHVKVLVLDEADEMLDLGFLPDVEKILARTPELRQTMLFSATMPSAVVGLARKHMRHPVNIRAEHPNDEQTVPTTAQFVYQVHDLDKPEIAARILQAENRGLTILFTRTKREAQRVADDLAERGFPASPLHGDMQQVARERALRRFREGKIDVLVATDVAARGIDVEGVTHVINYNCPEDDKTYVHRTGRTGRAGASGIAVTFVDWADLNRWKLINSSLGLPYPDPTETYSTSEHLFHDMGIPPGTRGRLVPPHEDEPQPVSSGRSPARSSGRQRQRTRGGKASDRPAMAEPATGGQQTKVNEPTESATGTNGRAPARRRSRSRTRRGKPVEAD